MPKFYVTAYEQSDGKTRFGTVDPNFKMLKCVAEECAQEFNEVGKVYEVEIDLSKPVFDTRNTDTEYFQEH